MSVRYKGLASDGKIRRGGMCAAYNAERRAAADRALMRRCGIHFEDYGDRGLRIEIDVWGKYGGGCRAGG